MLSNLSRLSPNFFLYEIEKKGGENFQQSNLTQNNLPTIAESIYVFEVTQTSNFKKSKYLVTFQ